MAAAVKVAQLDPALGVRIVATRVLRYTTPATAADDRPAHVRAASGLVHAGGRLVVIQDDAAFVATVAGDEVAAIALPRGAGGRRRFEVALGNKYEKLDLESCVAVEGALWAFGSGSTPVRERVVVVDDRTRTIDAVPLYRRIRDQLGPINLEGAAVVGDELWLFHRGNTGPADHGPAVVRFGRAAVASWLHGLGALPAVLGTTSFDLGAVGHARFGFTDAVAVGERVFFVAAAEASPDAIADGLVLGTRLGVIAGDGVRVADLGTFKAEGLAFDPGDSRRAWIVIDPDDVAAPAQLCELALEGPW
jgi:hypothetical protein